MKIINNVNNLSLRLVIDSNWIKDQSFSLFIKDQEIQCIIKNNILKVYGNRMVSHEDILYSLLQNIYNYDWNKYYHKKNKTRDQGLSYMSFLAAVGEIVSRVGTFRVGGESMQYLMLYLPNRTNISEQQLQHLKNIDLSSYQYIEICISGLNKRHGCFTDNKNEALKFIENYVENHRKEKKTYIFSYKNKKRITKGGSCSGYK